MASIKEKFLQIKNKVLPIASTIFYALGVIVLSALMYPAVSLLLTQFWPFGIFLVLLNLTGLIPCIKEIYHKFVPPITAPKEKGCKLKLEEGIYKVDELEESNQITTQQGATITVDKSGNIVITNTGFLGLVKDVVEIDMNGNVSSKHYVLWQKLSYSDKFPDRFLEETIGDLKFNINGLEISKNGLKKIKPVSQVSDSSEEESKMNLDNTATVKSQINPQTLSPHLNRTPAKEKETKTPGQDNGNDRQGNKAPLISQNGGRNSK
jgi:hypothetical protein